MLHKEDRKLKWTAVTYFICKIPLYIFTQSIRQENIQDVLNLNESQEVTTSLAFFSFWFLWLATLTIYAIENRDEKQCWREAAKEGVKRWAIYFIPGPILSALVEIVWLIANPDIQLTANLDMTISNLVIWSWVIGIYFYRKKKYFSNPQPQFI